MSQSRWMRLAGALVPLATVATAPLVGSHQGRERQCEFVQ